MSSSHAAIQAPPRPATPRKRKRRIGGARKLDKRAEMKSDGRYLIYYRPA